MSIVDINKTVKEFIKKISPATANKFAEIERNDMNQRIQSIFHEHTAIMIIINPVTGKIIDANPSAVDFYGYSREEITQLYIHDINMLPKEEVAKKVALASENKQRYFIFPHRIKSGEIKLVDVYASPVRFGDKQVLFSIIFDVTDRENYKKELQIKKEQFETTLLSISDAVISTDNKGGITFMNQVAVKLTGYPKDEAYGIRIENVFRIINEQTGIECENPIYKALHTGNTVHLEENIRLISKDGKGFPIEDSASAMKDVDGNIIGAVIVFHDATDKREKIQKIESLSYKDSLTGLYNRRYLENVMKDINILVNIPISIIVLDINGLKLTNDAYGHEVGDILIKRFADILKKSCSENDIVARVGGDEFVLLLPRTAQEHVTLIENRIKKYAEEETKDNILISYALGSATLNSINEDIHDFWNIADGRMYQNKVLHGEQEKNRIIEMIIQNINSRNIQEEEHSLNVSAYCKQLAVQMKLGKHEIEDMIHIGLLHDIGKIAIPANLLYKPDVLKEEEYEVVKQHPRTGQYLLRNTMRYSKFSDVVLHHHERWDGLGYPDGLQGEEIPLYSRMIAVCDAFEAMTSPRLYRQPKTREEAMEELIACSGTQFDPEIVKCFANRDN